jgi:hypothetical protein
MAINPIIQAFLAAAEQGQRDYQLAEQTRQTQEANRIQQEQFSEKQKQERLLADQHIQMQRLQLSQQKTISDAAHKIQQDQLKLEQQKTKLSQIADISKLYGSGALKIPEKQTTKTVPYAFVNGGEQVTTSEPDYDAAAAMLANITGGDTGSLSEMVKMIAGPKERQAQEIEKLKALSGIKVAESGQIAEAQAKAKSPFDLKLEEAKQSNRMAIEAEETARAKEVADIRGKYQVNAAAIRAAKKASAEGEAVPESIMQDIIRGDLDVSMLGTLGSQKYRESIMNAASNEGIKILTKDQKKILEKGRVLGGIFDKVEELNTLYKNGVVFNPKNLLRANTLISEINAVIANAARVVGSEVGVLTQPDIERVQGLLPTFWNGLFSETENDRKVKDFRKSVADTFGSIIGTMGSTQKGAIVDRYSLRKFIFMSDEEAAKLVGGK